MRGVAVVAIEERVSFSFFDGTTLWSRFFIAECIYVVGFKVFEEDCDEVDGFGVVGNVRFG